MSWKNKVVWSEGLFLRPQLFQQQERYLENFAHQRAAPFSPFFWGFSRYTIDHSGLSLGKLILSDAAGIFSDGTPFDIPGSNPPPAPLSIQIEHLDQIIYLAVPIQVPNGEETCFEEQADSLARFQSYDYELCDGNSVSQGPKLVQLSNPRLRLLPQKELTSGWIGLPIAKIAGVHSDGSVELHHNSHIPPVNRYGADPMLVSWLNNVHGLLHLRADALASRLTGRDGKTGETAEVADYLLLQIINRYEPLLGHMLKNVAIPPVEMYTTLLTLAGELSTFVRPKTRRPNTYPDYQHDQLYPCLRPLVDDVQRLLNAVLVRSAQSIPFEQQAHGVYQAVVDTTTLASFGALVLAVSAEMALDVLQSRFLAQSKLAPSELLHEIVRSHLPGVGLQTMPVPPRQIPFNAGYIYFEVNRSGQLWEQIAKRGGIAMHIAGEFSNLSLQLWGIRD